MKSKLIILLMFASLAESAYFPTLKVDYGLSEKQMDIFHKILVVQEETITRFFAGYTVLFDTIVDPKAESVDHCSQIAKALAIVKTAANSDLNPDVLAMGKSCSGALEGTLKKAYANFEDIFARIGTALKLAELGNYRGNRAAIEIQHVTALKSFKNLLDIDYDILNTCSKTTEPDILLVIEEARNHSYAPAIHVGNGIFNAIQVYAAAVPLVCGDVNFIYEIKDLKDKVFANVKSYIEYKFSTFRTIFINSCLNQCGIVFGVAKSQYTESVSFHKYKEGNDGILGIAKSYLKRIDLGLYEDDDDNAFTATNISYAKIIAAYDIGDEILLDLILFINPGSSSKIDMAREYLHTVSVEGNTIFIEVFNLAATRGTNHSETLNTIETLKNAAVSPASDYTQYIFDLIRNNRTFDYETEAKLAILQNVTYQGAAINTVKFFYAAEILANASYRGFVSEVDYSVMDVFLDESNQALDGFTQGITAACLLVFRVNCKLGHI